jgi:FxsC-like protein
MSDYWFFLSYARRNDIGYTLETDDKTRKLVRRLYEDLAAEIISRGNVPGRRIDEVGFFDQVGIEPGARWDEIVAEALRETRVMLCLFSRNYFASKVCGQEFEIFRGRVESYARANNVASPPLIIPVLWHRPDKLPTLPQAVEDLQYTFDEFSALYVREGLEYIMRLKKHDDEYQEFLIRLADRVVEVGEDDPLPPLTPRPSLRMARNAFAPRIAAPAPAAAATADALAAVSGPNFVHFAFVVGQRGELTGMRSRLDAYADDVRLWKPYVPDVDRPVGLLTQRVATDVDLQHEVMRVSDGLLAQLEAADDTNTIVILIVDPWTLKLLEVYEQQMRQYDRRNLISCAVLIVWNEKDAEPGIAPNALQAKVRETFRNNLTNNNMYIRARIASEAELQEELTKAIVEVRRRLNERAKLFREIDTAGFDTVPQVAAPSGAAQ